MDLKIRWEPVGRRVILLAKLSISIPDELKDLLDERAGADQVPVSYVVSEALRSYFSLPSQPQGAAASPELAEQLQAIQGYLWELHFSHECARSATLNLHYWAQRNGQTLGMPPDEEMPKPPWPKPAKASVDSGKKPVIPSKKTR